MSKALKPLLSLVMLLVTCALSAQLTSTYTHPHRLYTEAVELFDKEKFAAAYDAFHQFIQTQDDRNEELRVASEYHRAICALYLFHDDAEYRLETFVTEHSDSPWVIKVYFELATYSYDRKRYKKAMEWFTYVEAEDLSNKDLLELYFKRGHSAFEQENFELAKMDLSEVKDTDSEYAIAATYYHSHILYQEGNYESALQGFEKLKNDANFAPVVPYYIAQILYKQGRYEQMVEFAAPLLDSSNTKKTKRVPEIARLVGDSYYRNDEFAKSLPYLELYHEKTNKSDKSRADFFQLGFCYYNIGDYPKALDALNECSKEDDEMAQSAIYYMADCYMKLDQKPYARSAFKEAAEFDHNIQLKEDALFNYAKLAFELSYNPFHEAIQAFEQYLDDYPNSERSDEAYEFLLNVYMKSRNYEAALASLDKIENKDDRTKEAYQVVAYNRAVELFQSKKYDEAAEFFDKVGTYKVNQPLYAESIFWKAENAFRQEKYRTAGDLYRAFIAEPGAFDSDFFEEANYGAGYSHFKLQEYDKAIVAFRKYADNYKSDDPKKLNDAFLRIGDCYYVDKKYDQAIKYYDSAIKLEQAMKDYAMFQKGICYGLKEDSQKKITVLKQLLDTQPGSKYTADTKYELAKTYLAADQLSNAEGYYNDIIENHPSPYVKHSLVDLCLIYYKKGDDDGVIRTWKKLLADYANDPVLADALVVAQGVLIENGEDASIPDDLMNQQEIEQQAFSIAEGYVIDGDYDQAIERLNSYLSKYEPALYAVNANYYLGKCYLSKDMKPEALNAFNYVISQPVGDFTEECLVEASTINFEAENWQQARNNFIELEHVAVSKVNVLMAELGLLDCYYALGERDYVLEYAEKIIANENAHKDDKARAHLLRGNIKFEDGLVDDAYYDYVEVVKAGGERGAEAKFHMAEIAYQKQAWKPAEKEVFELIENFAGYSKWKYSGFLLLVDIYIGMEDYFQARATLNTILDNVSEPWVIDEARAKLDRLDVLESGGENRMIQEDDEIDLSGEEGGEQ